MTMKISKKVNFIAFLLISIIFIFEITYSMLFEDTCNLKIPGGIIILTAVLFVISSISYFLRKEENHTTSYCPITFYISGNSENGFIMTYKAFTFMDYNYYRGEFKTLEECYEHAKNVCKLKENAYPVVKYLVIGHLELGPNSVGVYSDCFSIACVGRDEDEAKKLFSDAVIMHFEGLVEDGEWVPEKYEISFEYEEIKFEHQGVTGIVRNNQELGIPNDNEDIYFTGEITNLGRRDITFSGDSYISFHKAFIDSAELFIKECKSQCMYSDNKRKIVFVENSKYGYSANCADRRVLYIGFGDSIEGCVENFIKNTQELDCEFEFRVMIDVHIGYSENLYSLYSEGYFSIFIENKENILSSVKNILSAASEYRQKTFSEIPIRHHVKFNVPESLKDYVETFVIDVDGRILTSKDF